MLDFTEDSLRIFKKISIPLCRLLEKDAKFDFDESCKSAFEEIKSILVSAPIILTHTETMSSKLYVMLVIMQWELY